MVTIRDVDGKLRHLGFEDGDRLDVGDRPDSIHDAQVVGRLVRSMASDRRFERHLRLVEVVGVEPKDLAQIGPAGLPEFQPVGLGAAVRFLVRVDVALAPRSFSIKGLEPNTAHEAAADVVLATRCVLLVADVNRGVGLGHQCTVPLPLLEQLGGSGVAVVLVVVARLVLVEDQANHVALVGIVKFAAAVRGRSRRMAERPRWKASRLGRGCSASRERH